MQRTPEGTGLNMPDPPITEGYGAPLGFFISEDTLPPMPSNVINIKSLAARHEALQPESFFMGYNLKDPGDAKAYLIEVHGFDLPEAKGDFDKRTLYHLARAIQKEKRAAIYERTDPSNEIEPFAHQNVAEHSFNVSVTALSVAAAERPDLDLRKVGIMAPFHDLVPEAYGRDTQIYDKTAMESKWARETASTTIFYDEIGHDSEIAQVMQEYEEGRTPEARFVKGMDKVEAAQLSLDTRAILHIERRERFEDVARGYLVRASIDHTSYDLMRGIMVELGRKWNSWGCIPIEGDPEEMVDSYIREIEAKSAEVLAFEQATPNGAPIPEMEPPIGELKHFPTRGDAELAPLLQPVISIDELQARHVAVLSLRRRTKPTPPPTDPGQIAAMAA